MGNSNKSQPVLENNGYRKESSTSTLSLEAKEEIFQAQAVKGCIFKKLKCHLDLLDNSKTDNIRKLNETYPFPNEDLRDSNLTNLNKIKFLLSMWDKFRYETSVCLNDLGEQLKIFNKKFSDHAITNNVMVPPIFNLMLKSIPKFTISYKANHNDCCQQIYNILEINQNLGICDERISQVESRIQCLKATIMSVEFQLPKNTVSLIIFENSKIGLPSTYYSNCKPYRKGCGGSLSGLKPMYDNALKRWYTEAFENLATYIIQMQECSWALKKIWETPRITEC